MKIKFTNILEGIAIALSSSALAAGLFAALYLYSIGDDKPAKLRNLETKIAADMELKSFNITDFNYTNPQDDQYYFTFSGNGKDLQDNNLEYLMSKYQISQENYQEIATLIENGDFRYSDTIDNLLIKILDVLNESELVDNGKIESLSKAIYNKDSQDFIALREVSKPVIDKDKGLAYYQATMIKYTNSNPIKVEEIRKRVVVKLTKEMEQSPALVYLADKKDCKVTSLSKNIINNKETSYTR